MPWVQITLSSTPENSEFLEDMLLLCGSSAVSMLDGADQPVFEPIKGTTPLWQDTRVMGLFDADTDAEALVEYLKNGWKEAFSQTTFPHYKLEILEDKDWEREWMDRFEPIQFGERLWVCPSWKPVPDPSAAEDAPCEQVDVMIANILAGPLIDMASKLASLTKPNGLIALSGILEHQAQAVIEAYEPWFNMHSVSLKDEWVRIDGIKR